MEIFRSSRWRLLERLEDAYWKCCAGCLHLQPKWYFSRSELYKEPNDRYCKAPGLIEICPHVMLTYNKCVNLQAALMKAKNASNRGDGGQASPPTTMLDLKHQCVFDSDKTKVTCTVMPKLSDRYNQLVFQNKYTVSDFNLGTMRSWMDLWGEDTLLPCPHRNISTHVSDMLNMHQPWSRDMIPQLCDSTSQQVRCKFCSTYFIEFETSEETVGTRTVSFSTQRHIGKDWDLFKNRSNSESAKRVQQWVNRTDLSNILSVVGASNREEWSFSRKFSDHSSGPTVSWKRWKN